MNLNKADRKRLDAIKSLRFNKPDMVEEESSLKGRHFAWVDKMVDRTQCILN